MELTLTTPALLFPAISLLLLAYTNRFLVLAQLIRQLHSCRVHSRSNAPNLLGIWAGPSKETELLPHALSSSRPLTGAL